MLSFFVKLLGYPAKSIADRLQKKGGDLAAPPEGFYVAGTEGPLLEGELDRAAQWAREMAQESSGATHLPKCVAPDG